MSDDVLQEYAAKQQLKFYMARTEKGEKRCFRDDCGAWQSVRSVRLHYDLATLRQLLYLNGVYCVRQQVDGCASAVPLEEQPTKSDIITVQHYLSNLQRDNKYKCRVTFVEHKQSVALLEYLGTFPETIASHGNSKSGGEYIRTAPHVIGSIASACHNNKPKTVYVNKINAANESDRPRNLKQVQNTAAKNTKLLNVDGKTRSSQNFVDEIQTLISEVTHNDFVQAVFVTKGHTPSVVLYQSQQISDMQRFCASSAPQNMRSIFAVDRTFNLSSLFVTVTVFKHHAVLRRNTNDYPVFLGPVLLHGDGSYTTYRQFLSHLHDAMSNDISSTELRIQESILTGSDEEHALVKGTLHSKFTL